MGDTSGVAVFGGGPAGLMAAETIARAGVRVTVHDHMRSVGRKFLLAGRSGLNLTHTEPLDSFVERYDTPGRMGAILDAFAPSELRSWCESLGVATFVGSSGRIFPTAFRATPLLRAWLQRLAELGVEFSTEHRWLGWNPDGSHRVVGPDGVERTIDPTAAVLAFGGASWPRVGADGGWLTAFIDAGIEVRPLVPSNAAARVTWSPTFVERFSGVPVKNVAISMPDVAPVRGDIVVTDRGLEGGPVYAMSRPLRAALAGDHVGLTIDLHPDLTLDVVRARLARRRRTDSQATWLRRTLGLDPIAVGLLREATGNRLPSEPDDMARLVKACELPVDALAGLDRAISTAGGVALSAVDDHLMLRQRPGTFVAGEMLDIDAPTGGYLLQAAFSTAVVAARAAVAYRAPTARGGIA